MGVVRLGNFGSRVRGPDRPDSGVDVLVELEPGRDLFDPVMVTRHLEASLSLPADVTTASGLCREKR